MANMEERLQAVVAQAETDGSKWHTIIHGDNATSVSTENGNVPTVAKQLKDVYDAITGGVADVVAEAEAARDEAIAAKNTTNQLKSDTTSIKADTLAIKNQAAEVFNNISTATNTAISNIQTEASTQVSNVKNTGTTQVNTINSTGTTQVNNVKSEGSKQITLATEQANLSKYYAESCAPAPLGSRLSVPANKKVPDGYEPVWYKNTITRERYPDFFEQLVDTNYLVFTTEATYDSQVSSYGMCASYVKVDNNTVILPLLKNYARGGTTDNLGTVLNDQFQGHGHHAYIECDQAGGSGYPKPLPGATRYTQNTDKWVTYPTTYGNNGAPRYGDETRPKSYYELTYIKCADISRPLSSETTSEIRTQLAEIEALVSSIPHIVAEQKGLNWYIKWSNGVLEQGGVYGSSSTYLAADSSITLNFNLAFVNTNYTFLNTVTGNSTTDSGWCSGAFFEIEGKRTTSKVILNTDGVATSRIYRVNWYARGYWK